MDLIHIKELFRLQGIGRLRLVAGQEGLERTVSEAVLFEYDPSRMQLPDFYRGDLVVTTLAYARSDAQLVTASLLALMNQGIACLLVKTAYFTELPQTVLDRADRERTPIFLFDDTYIEEVILKVTELIRGRRHFAGFEKELSALARGDLTGDQVRAYVRRIDPVGFDAYRILALFPVGRVTGLEDKLYALLCQDAQTARRCVFMEWKHMLLALCSADGDADSADGLSGMDALLARAGVERAALIVGASGVHRDTASFGLALREAAYAARAAKLCGRPSMPARELGIYGYLLPMSEDAFARSQCRQIMAKIRDYDAQNHTNLEHTASVYVQQNMEVALAAKVLYQHPNTVRYRLSKIAKIMGLEGSALFEPMLNLTVNLINILDGEDQA